MNGRNVARVYGQSMKLCGQRMELWWLHWFPHMELIHAMARASVRAASEQEYPRQIASPRAIAAALRIAEMLAL